MSLIIGKKIRLFITCFELLSHMVIQTFKVYPKCQFLAFLQFIKIKHIKLPGYQCLFLFL